MEKSQKQGSAGKTAETQEAFILTFVPCENIIISIEVNGRKGNYCGSN